jgi:hypothetical protein
MSALSVRPQHVEIQRYIEFYFLVPVLDDSSRLKFQGKAPRGNGGLNL